MRRIALAHVVLWRLLAGLLLVNGSLRAFAAAELSIARDPDGRPRLSATAREGDVVVIESGSELSDWEELLRGHGPLSGVADLTAGRASAGFYRALTRARGAEDDWKNVVRGGGDEPFQSEDPSPWDPSPRWIKFALLLAEPHRVYFQDSVRHAFHYDFAVARLPQFQGMTHAQFDAVTLRTNGQQAVLGAVLFAPGSGRNEAGIQFVGQDAYPREKIVEWFHTVRAMIMAPGGMQTFYLPTFEQADVARQHSAWFAEQGVQVASVSRWVSGDECYAPGWALGRLVFVPATEIENAYREGTLRAEDVLLTDAVPAEVPPLAGIVSLTPATPNSHVALLAQSFGIPFVYLSRPDVEEELKSWAGRDVLVQAVQQFMGCDARVAVLGAPLDAELREEILAVKLPPPLQLTPKEVRGQISVPVDGLAPADIRHVGGKAANLGILRRAIPDHSPSPVIAFTFDLWNGYLAQTMNGGQTLGQYVEATLGGYSWPPDTAALDTALQTVRDVFTDDADFNAEQREAILAALQAAGFDPLRKIRFRSSTNVEDSEQFTGAGLYDSYSGCLADDLDGDSTGPSRCDATEKNERGVFRALRKVYASFYNDNAFLERLRHRVNEEEVGMAVLVHYSTPDEFELANGVATLRIHRSVENRSVDAELVSQAGAVSVSNPDSSAIPEVVDVSHFTPAVDPSFDVTTRSSLVQLGATVLDWPAEYEELYDLLNTASLRWEQELPSREQWILDFEYKKVAPDGALRIKQIRPLPVPVQGDPGTRWLLNTTNRWGVFQGEFGDLMAMHRLKSFWTFESRHTGMAVSNLADTLFLRVDGRWIEGTNETSIAGPITNLPGHQYTFRPTETVDRWDAPGGPRELRVSLERFAVADQGPVALLDDLRLEFGVKYDTAQAKPEFLPNGGINTVMTSEERVFLAPLVPVTPESLLQERELVKGSRSAVTRFYWPPPPKGISAGYTANLQAWVETTLTGFTSQPIILRGDFSQTYHPGHHNFWEEFVFDPWLEPGVDPAALAELAAANIRAVVAVRDGQGEVWLSAWGLDGTFRTLP